MIMNHDHDSCCCCFSREIFKYNNNMMWPLLKFFTEEDFRVTEEFFSKTSTYLGSAPPAADRVVTCPWATQRPAPNSSG
jgi:hypothetical protein